MPDKFHQQQYVIAAGLMLAFGCLYCFAPERRAEGLLSLATAAAGFLFGKFSNGYNRHQRDEDDPEERLLSGKGHDK